MHCFITRPRDSDAPAPVVPEKKGMRLPRYMNSLLDDDNTDIKLKALYDPHLLKDYGGPIFVHKRAKLVQRDIKNSTGNLIPPYEEYESLRTGTVVLMKVTLKVYCVPAGNKIRKVSQTNLFLFS